MSSQNRATKSTDSRSLSAPKWMQNSGGACASAVKPSLVRSSRPAQGPNATFESSTVMPRCAVFLNRPVRRQDISSQIARDHDAGHTCGSASLLVDTAGRYGKPSARQSWPRQRRGELPVLCTHLMEVWTRSRFSSTLRIETPKTLPSTGAAHSTHNAVPFPSIQLLCCSPAAVDLDVWSAEHRNRCRNARTATWTARLTL